MSLQDSQILIQLIGFVGLSLSILAFQFNKRSTILKLQTFSALMYTAHFFLLGAFTGSAASAVTALRNYVYQRSGKSRGTWLIPAVFAVIFVVVGILAWEGWISLLLIIASLAGVIAYWQSNPKVIRLAEAATIPLWIVYDVVSRSYPGIIMEVFLLTSTLVGIYRFDIRKVRSPGLQQKSRS